MVPLGTLKNNNGVYVFFFVKNANLFDDASTVIIDDCRIWSVIRTMMLDAIHIMDLDDDELDDILTSLLL